MICNNLHRLVAVRTLVSATVLATGLLTSTSSPLLAQTSGTWASTGTLNTPRGGHTATLLANGQVLVVGGENTSGLLTSAELYNPATGKWTLTDSTATPRLDHTATLLPNGQVLVAGGTNSDDTSGDTAELYDPSKGTWKATGSLHNYHPLALTLLQDGRALKVDASGTTGASGELYDPSKGQWTLTAGTYYSHTGVSTALLPNGDLLVYGNKFSCYAGEFYNPSANTWTHTLGQCGNSISFGPLTLLGSGKVLLAGGTVQYSGKSFPTANCRLYDPATNSWSVTGSLLQAFGHTATRLFNGQVLAVGGSNAELYTP